MLLLSACATPSYQAVAPAASPLYFYPQHQQSAAQQDRDRYECYRWAVERTRTDPGMTPLRHDPAAGTVVVEDVPPGRDTMLGALAGAAIGGIAAPSGRSGDGAAIGLVLGALFGAISEQHRLETARQVRPAAPAAYAGRATPFERAMSACMSARGYVVR